MANEAPGLGFDPDPSEDNHTDIVATALIEAPVSSVDLEYMLPPVQNQRSGASCVAWAVAHLLHAAHVRGGQAKPELASVQLLWWLCRLEAGLQTFNVGTYIRRACRLAAEQGIARARHCPYDARGYDRQPPKMAARMAADQRADAATRSGRAPVSYRRLPPRGGDRAEDVRSALAAGFPVAAGWDITVAFRDNKLDFLRPIDVPDRDDPIAGGHAMTIWGYTADGNFQIRNQYGRDFGLGGNFIATPDFVRAGRDPWIVISAPRYSDSP